MSNIKLQMQDHQGNILHPETDAELVIYGNGNAKTTFDELVARKKVFVQNEQPTDDGVWFDTSDSQENATEENPIVKNIRDYIDGNIKPPIDKNTQDIKTMSGKLDAGLNALSQVPNPSLLINGDFQVWQRGISFANINGYTVDRWRIGSDVVDSIQVTKSDNGVKIKALKVSDFINFLQIIEDDTMRSVLGKKVTITFKFKEATDKVSQIWGAGLNSEKTTVYHANKTFEGVTSDTFIATIELKEGLTKNEFGIQIKPTAENQEFEILWAKFEIGEKATPLTPRPYGEELALCQRYYETSLPFGEHNDGTVLYRYRNNASAEVSPIEVGCTFSFKTQKRVVPSVKFRYDFDDTETKESTNAGITTKNFFSINTIMIPTGKALDISSWDADAEIY